MQNSGSVLTPTDAVCFASSVQNLGAHQVPFPIWSFCTSQHAEGGTFLNCSAQPSCAYHGHTTPVPCGSPPPSCFAQVLGADSCLTPLTHRPEDMAAAQLLAVYISQPHSPLHSPSFVPNCLWVALSHMSSSSHSPSPPPWRHACLWAAWGQQP